MITIIIENPGNIDSPPAGKVTLFVDSTNNKLSAKNENGNVVILSDTPII